MIKRQRQRKVQRNRDETEGKTKIGTDAITETETSKTDIKIMI